jgi:hypothetical protein
MVGDSGNFLPLNLEPSEKTRRQLLRCVHELQKVLELLSWLVRVRKLRVKSIPISFILRTKVLPSSPLLEDQQLGDTIRSAMTTLATARTRILEHIAAAPSVAVADLPTNSALETLSLPAPSPLADSSEADGSDTDTDYHSPRFLVFQECNGRWTELEIVDSANEAEKSEGLASDDMYDYTLDAKAAFENWDAIMGFDPDVRNEKDGGSAPE